MVAKKTKKRKKLSKKDLEDFRRIRKEQKQAEKDYYKYIFDKYYSGYDNIIPYYWMPKWSGNLDNPSNRLIIQ